MDTPIIQPGALPQNQGVNAPTSASGGPAGGMFSGMTPQQQQMLFMAMQNKAQSPQNQGFSNQSIPAAGSGGFANALAQGLQGYTNGTRMGNQMAANVPLQITPPNALTMASPD